MTKAPLQRKAYNSGLLQGKAYRILTSHLTEVLLPYNLSIPEWKLLGQLADGGNMKLAKLAELLAVEAPLVTSLVDSLEKKGLVTRSNDPIDKRAKVIEGTKRAFSLVDDIEPKVKAKVQILLHGTTIEDLNAYIRILNAIVKNG
jgi:MarR family transcriptional regulator for hemolysin